MSDALGDVHFTRVKQGYSPHEVEALVARARALLAVREASNGDDTPLSLLERAQTVADEEVRSATSRTEAMLVEARREADIMLAEARERADQVLAEAQAEAGASALLSGQSFSAGGIGALPGISMFEGPPPSAPAAPSNAPAGETFGPNDPRNPDYDPSKDPTVLAQLAQVPPTPSTAQTATPPPTPAPKPDPAPPPAPAAKPPAAPTPAPVANNRPSIGPAPAPSDLQKEFAVAVELENLVLTRPGRATSSDPDVVPVIDEDSVLVVGEWPFVTVAGALPAL